MSTFNLNDLSDEILYKIFKNLNVKTLVNLTEVCKRFNDLISGNIELLKIINIDWNRYLNKMKNKDFDVLLSSKRKYQSITICEIDESLLKILKKFPFTEVCFEATDVPTIYKLQEILIAVAKNIEKIYFYSLRMKKTGSVDDQNIDPVEFPKLNKVKFSETSCWNMVPIFGLFRGAVNLREFKYQDDYYYKLQDHEAAELSRTLASFDGLKILKIRTYGSYFFNDDYLAKNAKFQLKSYINDCFVENYVKEEWKTMDFEEHFANQCIHWMKFINGQRACLERLEITRYSITSEIIDIILSMEMLSTVKMSLCTYRITKTPSTKNVSIKYLEIKHFSKYDKEFEMNIHDEPALDRDAEMAFMIMLSNCLNVENLVLSSFEVTSGMSMSIAIYMKNLEKISFIENPKIFPISLSSVKSMNFDFYSYGNTMTIVGNSSDIKNLIEANQQLRIMHIPEEFVKSARRYSPSMNLRELPDRLHSIIMDLNEFHVKFKVTT